MNSSKLVTEIKQALTRELSHTLEYPDKEWDIWMEGFACTGNVGNAVLLESSVVAKSFSRSVLYLRFKKDRERSRVGELRILCRASYLLGVSLVRQ